MPLRTVGILSPGDMGHMVGRVLGEHGLRVIACNPREKPTHAGSGEERKHHSRANVPAACGRGGSHPVNPRACPSHGCRRECRAGAWRNQTELVYADCNAIAPQTVLQIDEIITAVGGTFVDASIIGPPPKNEGATRFYASGGDLRIFRELNRFGLDIRHWAPRSAWHRRLRCVTHR